MHLVHAVAVGDVLIRTVRGGASPLYTLSSMPGPDQLSFPSMADATRHALAFGRHAGVDVWVDSGENRADRLAEFRNGRGDGRHEASVPFGASRGLGGRPPPVGWVHASTGPARHATEPLRAVPIGAGRANMRGA